MARTTKEWIADHDDQSIPPRVRLRVWDRANGHCQSCTRRIAAGDKWECDHITALINGGEHREANFQLLCSTCHKAKTSADVAEKSKVADVRKKHLGIRKSRSSFLTNRDGPFKKRMDGTVERRET